MRGFLAYSPSSWGGGTLVITLGFSMLVAQFGRHFGKTKEQRLWESWDGPPTTRFLRHKSVDYILEKAMGKSQSILDEEYLKKEYERLTDPLAYYDAHIGKDKNIFRFLVTHPDMDHMTGLHRIHAQEKSKSIINFWHTGDHDFNLSDTSDEEWEKSPYDKRDWEAYKKLRKGDVKSLQNYQGATGDYWTEDGVEIWAPTPELETLAIEKDEPNILSHNACLTFPVRAL